MAKVPKIEWVDSHFGLPLLFGKPVTAKVWHMFFSGPPIIKDQIADSVLNMQDNAFLAKKGKYGVTVVKA